MYFIFCLCLEILNNSGVGYKCPKARCPSRYPALHSASGREGGIASGVISFCSRFFSGGEKRKKIKIPQSIPVLVFFEQKIDIFG